MGAFLLKTPELDLDPEEAKKLAEGTANVLRHYPSVTMPAQALDWIGLATCIGMVYGPRLVAIRMRNRSGRAAPVMRDVNAPRENVATVTPSPAAPSNDDNMIDVPGMPGVRILRPVQ